MSGQVNHKIRAHSKFSASGSERWLNCPASVALEEKAPPSVDSFWSREGTLAHEVLECVLLKKPVPKSFDVTDEMLNHVSKVAGKILRINYDAGGPMLVEKRVYASFIHEEMFGTCDVIIPGNDRHLHIGDFKYGAGHIVSAKKNTQLVQYALSTAESYGWDEHFDRVTMWIFQPRASEKGFDSWTIEMSELKNYWLPLWQKGVKRVLENKSKPFPGHWCHYCRARNTCPAKAETQMKKVTKLFAQTPIERR